MNEQGQNGQAANVQVDPTHVIQSLKRQMADAAARAGEEIAMRDGLIEQLGAENKQLRETLDQAADKSRSPRLVEAAPADGS